MKPLKDWNYTEVKQNYDRVSVFHVHVHSQQVVYQIDNGGRFAYCRKDFY